MGQYFYAVNADTFEYVSPTREGLKLMEHSLQANHFMLQVDRLLRENGKWYLARLVWAGDSANTERGLILPTIDDEDVEEVNLNRFVSHSTTDSADGDRMMPCNDPASDALGRYILNHDMLEFVDIEALPMDKWGGKVHPIPLLTSNNVGYYNADHDKVGRWVRCRISIQDYPSIDPKFAELKVAFLDE